MKYQLGELSLSMGRQEYDMYQDIPAKESGSTHNGGIFLNEDDGTKYYKIKL